MARIEPVSANNAMALGSTISWLNMSCNSQTRSILSTAPRNTKNVQMQANTRIVFLPKRYSQLSFAKRFHDRIVENAKNSRHMATKMLPPLVVKNWLNATCAMLPLSRPMAAARADGSLMSSSLSTMLPCASTSLPSSSVSVSSMASPSAMTNSMTVSYLPASS